MSTDETGACPTYWWSPTVGLIRGETNGGHEDAQRLVLVDPDDETEYRVQKRRPGGEWSTVITRRGGGRPYFSLGAAKGVLTREKEGEGRAHRYRVDQTPVPASEFRIQKRPVSAAWEDVVIEK